MIDLGTFVTILPSIRDGVETDELGYCCGWVREICADDCMLIEIKGSGAAFYVTNRRVRVAC